MRIVYMGSTRFSADILEELIRHFDVVSVYTQPDRVRGRGKKLTPTPVKELAEAFEIEVRTPESLKNAEEVEHIKKLDPDVICVSAYGAILPKDVLEIPKHGCLNVHASLLPRWRGAAPIERAIVAGDEYTGVCIMRMEEGLDTGAYCISRKIPIEDKDAKKLSSELSLIGAQALINALEQIESGTEFWIEQIEKDATYAEKIEKGELDLYPSYSTSRNLRHVKASGPAHPCKASIGDKLCIIDKAAKVDDDTAKSIEKLAPDDYEGTYVIDDSRLFLGDSDGFMEILSIKPAGKKLMDVKSWLQGAKLDSIGSWSAPK